MYDKYNFKKREHFLILSKMWTKTNNHVLGALTKGKTFVYIFKFNKSCKNLNKLLVQIGANMNPFKYDSLKFIRDLIAK